MDEGAEDGNNENPSDMNSVTPSAATNASTAPGLDLQRQQQQHQLMMAAAAAIIQNNNAAQNNGQNVNQFMPQLALNLATAQQQQQQQSVRDYYFLCLS